MFGKGKRSKIAAGVFIIFMLFTGMASSCQKGENDEKQVTGSVSKSASASITKAASIAKTAAASNTTKGNTATTSQQSKITNNISIAGNDEEIGSNDAEIAANPGQDTGADPGDVDGSGNGTGQGPGEKVFDLQGRELKFLTWTNVGSYLYPLSGDTDKITAVRLARMRKTEELFNCKFSFEIVEGGVSGNVNKIAESSIMAGVYFADAFATQRVKAVPAYEKNNLIIPLSDYVDFNKPVWQKFNHVTGLTDNSKIYSVFNTSMPWQSYGIWYNQAIFEREGIPLLCDLKEKGLWDWNMFIDIAVKLTKDNNGDGIIDQWGIATSGTDVAAISVLFSNGANMIGMVDNRCTYMLDRPESLKALQFVSDLYNTHKVLSPKNISTNEFAKAYVGMYIQYSYFAYSYWKPMGLKDVRYEEMPLGPDGNINSIVNMVSGNYYFIPSNVKEPDAVANAFAYWQCLWDDTAAEFINLDDVVAVQAEMRMYPEDVNGFIESYRQKTRVIDDYSNNFSSIVTLAKTNIFTKIATMNTTAASAVMEIKEQAQSILDDATAK